jgi:hypothetical protein
MNTDHNDHNDHVRFLRYERDIKGLRDDMCRCNDCPACELHQKSRLPADWTQEWKVLLSNASPNLETIP